MDLMKLLTSEGGENFEETWATFFSNTEKVRALKDIIDQDAAAAILTAGATWRGSGWNTARASKALFDLTVVPLVSADFRQYLNSFLYSLALLWEVDTPLIELSDRASEAAFGLATVFSKDQPPKGEFPEEGSEGEEHADMVMEWDEPLMSLPPELTYLWTVPTLETDD